MLLGRSFDSIDSDVINALVAHGIPESVYVEFKRETYGAADRDRKELLKDVSAFANTLGGYLVIGVDEDHGVAVAISPLTVPDIDAELRRLEQIARNGLKPGIVGLRIKAVRVPGGNVIVVHVPRSMNPPHRIMAQGLNRFYARHSTGAYEPTVEELRLLFGQRRSMEEQAERFAQERSLRISAGDAILPIPTGGGVLVLHLMPIADMASGRRHTLDAIAGQLGRLDPIGSSGPSWRTNLEGFCVYRGGEACHGYTQVFRNGVIEATSASVIRADAGRKIIHPVMLPERLLESFPNYIAALRSIGATPPILVRISLLNVAGLELALDPARYFEPAPMYISENLDLPSLLIPEYRVRAPR